MLAGAVCYGAVLFKPETDELEAGLDLTFHGERALDHD